MMTIIAWRFSRQHMEGRGMTNQQILRKAIEKAIDSGWHMFYDDILRFDTMVDRWGVDVGISNKKIEFWLHWRPNTHPDTKTNVFACDIEKVIYNHNFAKALWGKEQVMGEYGITGLAWIYHLQQMVIADDPIQYLGEHLDD